MLGAFDRADMVTAAQLHAAAAGFSEKTENRGRAGLTRDGVLVRGKRGMAGEVTYTIDRRQLASLATKYRSQRVSTTRQPRQWMANNGDATLPGEQYHDDYDDANDDDEDEDESSAGAGGWAWLAAIGLVPCVFAAVVWVRRRSGTFPIVDAAGPPLPAFTPGIAPRARQTPARRAARNAPIAAPYPGDEAIFGPDADEETSQDPNPGVDLNAYERFAAFPGLFDFAPESDA